MAYLIPGKTYAAIASIPLVPKHNFPPTGPFTTPTELDFFQQQDDLDLPESRTIPSGAWPGEVIDIFETIKRLKKSSNKSHAYDVQLIEYLARTVQLFGQIGLFHNPENVSQESNEWARLFDHRHYDNVRKILEQWAAYKETSILDPTLGHALQQTQVHHNVAPTIDVQSLQQAMLDVERRAIVGLAGGGRVGRGGRRGGRRSSRAVSSA
jgi:hypothetical protein